MWIKIENAHIAYADASKFDTLYLSYKGNGQYAIVASIGPRDIHIATYTGEALASSHLQDIVAQLGTL